MKDFNWFRVINGGRSSDRDWEHVYDKLLVYKVAFHFHGAHTYTTTKYIYGLCLVYN